MGNLNPIILALLLAFSASSQETKRLTHWNVERSGWTAPTYSDLVSEVKLLRTENIEGVDVQVKKHILSEEQITYVESCEPKKNETQTAERRSFAVREFFSYEVGGRVFAYRLIFYIVFVENGFITERAGAAVNLHYFDEDGAGTFEMRCNTRKVEKLPEWVKALGTHP